MITLLSAIQPQHEFLRGFRPEPAAGGASWWWIMLAVVITAAAAWIIVGVVQRDRRKHGPALRRVSRQLGLGVGQVRLLERVARFAGIRSAGSLLISRGSFDFATSRYVGRHGQADRLRAIRLAVFG